MVIMNTSRENSFYIKVNKKFISKAIHLNEKQLRKLCLIIISKDGGIIIKNLASN